MIKIAGRSIPQTMGTQHPDNANAPYWETDGDGFVSTKEEVLECASSFKDLGCEEYMWDWEGKHVDEGVIEKLLIEHHDFFLKNQIGKDRFLTFRIPNIWEEKGRSLARAFMNILTAEEFARDLNMHTPPLMEIILPMTDKAEKMIHMQKTFTKLANFKHELFEDQKNDFNYVTINPLIEGVHDMEKVRKLLDEYILQHKKYYKAKPLYIRPFLARSDPALVSGLVPAVLGNRIAISEIYKWSDDEGIPVFPWLGAGSLPFRGHLRPDKIDLFLKNYPGIRSATIQSSFRYDFDLPVVKRGVKKLNEALSKTKPVLLDEMELAGLKRINRTFEQLYQKTIFSIAGTINEIAEYVPSRRERRLHIGLLGYGRSVKSKSLPRAIKFTAALYSLGIPPELISTGRGIRSLSAKDLSLLEKHYITLEDDLLHAGQYLNKENIHLLSDSVKGINAIMKDIEALESYLGVRLGPRSSQSYIHRNWTSTLYFQRKQNEDMATAILESARIRKSLG